MHCIFQSVIYLHPCFCASLLLCLPLLLPAVTPPGHFTVGVFNATNSTNSTNSTAGSSMPQLPPGTYQCQPGKKIRLQSYYGQLNPQGLGIRLIPYAKQHCRTVQQATACCICHRAPECVQQVSRYQLWSPKPPKVTLVTQTLNLDYGQLQKQYQPHQHYSRQQHAAAASWHVHVSTRYAIVLDLSVLYSI